MSTQIPLSDDDKLVEEAEGGALIAAPDVVYHRMLIANVVFIGRPGAPGWILVDAGVMGTAGTIRKVAAARFGADVPPAAIVLTHGHFDHVGVLAELARDWDVPVWAHRLEKPYLDGSAAYPPPDPSVDTGLMARLSPLYPTAPVNVGERLHLLPEGSLGEVIPALAGWECIPTPGHSVGHVSFWRPADRLLVAGDAVVTTASESAYATAVQSAEMHGPPQYLTHDWIAAAASARRLAALEPEIVVSGHGRAMKGPGMRAALHRLAEGFEEIAVPRQGRYLRDPQSAEDGSAYRRP